ncbi:hypothetical protein COCC4DRAFT_33358 [Bipolaris maydis ATCC 48331]|uniref:Uncharacterized protein n=2 Tax=Cochliobolus heterostrophus TaxID=5016 RepID=M2UWB6_COCH5|nr:uncharacterized protein COCC4DRAFT_33358 [Bipolaris maydis ATCC 48331]EMD92107.1 hypothetical protein COCHEDRAFT_1021054 [Bipolaris maydis C5]ENI02410.1 hypothetical protein COCC4DRAFT_33358 [Bipolaris maydis ATCC 48331]
MAEFNLADNYNSTDHLFLLLHQMSFPLIPLPSGLKPQAPNQPTPTHGPFPPGRSFLLVEHEEQIRTRKKEKKAVQHQRTSGPAHGCKNKGEEEDTQ